MQTESDELAELEMQLSRPYGAKGLEVAEMMNASNAGMIAATISTLDLASGQHVLELGHGNCSHLALLLEQAPDLRYTGLEISELMHAEAIRLNAGEHAAGRACFERYDGAAIPFEDARFDRMFAVNCIYFWPDPRALLNEIFRVLRPGGLAAITYAHKSFMLGLPFVKDRFSLYDDAGFLAVISETRFHPAGMHQELEQVRIKSGALVERPFTVAVVQKTLD